MNKSNHCLFFGNPKLTVYHRDDFKIVMPIDDFALIVRKEKQLWTF